MKRQAGFTLIELVMVIVILGILSAFALPRFADLGSEARRATLQGAYGAIKSASSIAHADSLVNENPATVTLEGVAIAMVQKYPSRDDITDAAQIDAADFDIDVATANTVIVSPDGVTTAADCAVTYVNATATAAPVISIVTADCD
jgi:MSHA pilin protein MshA